MTTNQELAKFSSSISITSRTFSPQVWTTGDGRMQDNRYVVGKTDSIDNKIQINRALLVLNYSNEKR